jgi:hypothetical protein
LGRSCQLSAVSYQPSAISGQLKAESCPDTIALQSSGLLDRIEPQRGDLRLLRSRDLYLGTWIVVETGT